MDTEDTGGLERAKGLTGVQQVVDVFKSHGVEFIFGITGTDVYKIYNEVSERGIKVIDVRHECAAAYAAKAVGRITGRPGIVIVTAGPGVANTATGAMEAKMDEVPIIIIGGAPATFERGTGALHDVDHVSIMRPVCKRAFSVDSTEQLIPTLKKAFQISMSDVPGPVFISLTLNAMDSSYKSEYPEIRTNEIRDNVVAVNVGGATNDQDLTPLPVTFPKASAVDIERSVEILQSAKKPLIIVGSQVALSPERIDKVPPALESMGIPCCLNFTGKGLLGRNHKLLIEYNMKGVLAKADVVILAGIPTDFFFHYGIDLPKNGKIITVGRNEKTLTLNSPSKWRPSQVVHGDVNRYLVALSIALAKTSFTPDDRWIQTCQKLSSEEETYYKQKANEVTKEGHLNPLKILFALNKVAPDNVTFVSDVGDFAVTARHILRPPSPLSYLFYSTWANCGLGMGVAIGTKVCCPDRQVWLFSGDGSIGFHLSEINTCTRHNIPIAILVGNDGGWNEVARKSVEEYGIAIGARLNYADYHSVAKDFGGSGVKLDMEDDDKLEEELQKAQEKSKSGSSAILVNALMGTTDIRHGYA